jgi:uncharacterized membrane protein
LLTLSRTALWDKHGAVTELGPLDGFAVKRDYSSAIAINARGQIVGETIYDSIRPIAFLWQSGTFQRMFDPTLRPDGNEITFRGINNRGDIAGYTGTTQGCGTPAAFVIEKGKDFRLLPIPYTSVAMAINNSGEVAGSLATSPGTYCHTDHALVWDGKNLTVLPLLPGDTQSFAYAINNRGESLEPRSARTRGMR